MICAEANKPEKRSAAKVAENDFIQYPSLRAQIEIEKLRADN
jgi:hypothetical protein